MIGYNNEEDSLRIPAFWRRLKMKIVNKTKIKGPYPSKTWEQLYGKKKALFGFEVFPKVKDNECDSCMKECSPDWNCCSKECYDNLCADSEGIAEARGS
jgi:hypothetical protein